MASEDSNVAMGSDEFRVTVELANGSQQVTLQKGAEGTALKHKVAQILNAKLSTFRLLGKAPGEAKFRQLGQQPSRSSQYRSMPQSAMYWGPYPYSLPSRESGQTKDAGLSIQSLEFSCAVLGPSRYRHDSLAQNHPGKDSQVPLPGSGAWP